MFRERDHTVFRASVEDFHRSREAQSAFGDDTPERYYRYGVDESALRRVLVEPFRMAGSAAFVTRFFDSSRDAWVEPKWLTGPPDALLVLDGRFLLRDRLSGLWDYAHRGRRRARRPGRPDRIRRCRTRGSRHPSSST